MTYNFSSLIKIIGHQLGIRVMMFAFLFLTWAFGETFITTTAKDHIALTFIALVSFEATIIIVFGLLYDDESIGRDINTLNFYGLICHLLYVVGYLLHLQVGELHNNAIIGLMGVAFFRSLYFGSSAVFGPISILEIAKTWINNNKYYGHKTINRLTILLFVLCAAPLFTVIYVVNTDQMTITGIAIVLFTFHIALSRKNSAPPQAMKINGKQGANSFINESNSELNTDEALLLQLFNEKSVAGKADILRFAANGATAAGAAALSDVPTVNKKRELVHSLMDAYYATHPQAKNILIAVNWYFARAFPRNRDHNSLTLTERRRDWLMLIKELMFLGSELGKNKDTFTWGDFARFQATFESIFPSESGGREAILAGLEYAKQIGGLKATDTQIILAADILISAWFQLILKDDDDYFSLYPELEQVSAKFIEDNLVPIDDNNTSPFN